MPSFTETVPLLREDGAVLAIHVSMSRAAEDALRASGLTVPPPIPVQALIDTGATGTLIRTGLASSLGLLPLQYVPVNTACSAGILCGQYSIGLTFPDGTYEEVFATEMPIPGQNVQVLLGRDILAKGIFVYIGCSNVFAFRS